MSDKKNNESKAGRFNSTVYIDGKAYNCTTVKDNNGNIIHESVARKFLGIF